MLALYKGVVPACFLTTNGAIKVSLLRSMLESQGGAVLTLLLSLIAQFVAYESLKSVYQKHWSTEMDIVPTLIMGGIAQSIASSATYPYQVIKARLQQGGPAADRYTGTWDCTVKMFRFVRH